MTVSNPGSLRVQDAASAEETFTRLKARLAVPMPDEALRPLAELAFRINELKRAKHAAILGHNYMDPILYHSITDCVGDSLQLARRCTEVDADILLICGVRFMAETAKVLNPERMVLIPDPEAGCSLADGLPPAALRNLRKVYPGAPIITYVNTSAAAKAESDCCCTSGNAAAVLRHYVEAGCDRIVFLPDEHLAANMARDLGLDLVKAPEDLEHAPENAGVAPGRPTIISIPVRCEVHELFTVEDVEYIRAQHPDAVILAHPECPPEVIARCDIAGSTKRMLDYIRDEDAPGYVLLTDCAMTENLAVQFPHRNLIRGCERRCPHMERITLENTLASLERLEFQIELDPGVVARARKPIDKMLEIL